MAPMVEYGFTARHATAAAATAARSLAHGDVTARWRVVDEAIEVVRDSHGRVELYRVAPDGTYGLVDQSPRSVRRVGGEVLGYAGFGVAAAAFLGLAVADEIGNDALADAMKLTFFLIFPTLAVIGLLTPSSERAVRRWIRQRFGTEDGWSRVPRRAELGTATGNQQVVASSLADEAGRDALARLRDDGTLEVATVWNGMRTLHYVDRAGRITHTEQQRRRERPSLVTGSDWGDVRTDDPGD